MGDRFDQVGSFVRAVETGSFSAVARGRCVGQLTISNRVAALKKRPGVQLLSRTSRSVSLT